MSQGVFRESFPAGKIVDNFQTLGAVSDVSIVVPDGKRWLVLGCSIERDQNGTLSIISYNASDKELGHIYGYEAAGATRCRFGIAVGKDSATTQAWRNPAPLSEGMYVKYTWGVAQLTPEVSLVVLEV